MTAISSPLGYFIYVLLHLDLVELSFCKQTAPNIAKRRFRLLVAD